VTTLPIGAVCFDLDETLLDDNTSYYLSVRRAAEGLVTAHVQYDFDRLLDTYHEVADAYWAEVSHEVVTGMISSETVRLEEWRRALERCGCDDTDIAHEALGAYARQRIATYALFDDVIETLEAIPRETKVAIITNGWSFDQREKVARTGLLLYADAIVVSGEIGAAKPDLAIFDHALKLLGVAASGAVHVGDGLESDVLGAQKAGFRAAVWLNRHGKARESGQPEPEYEIASLRGLGALL
jgi:putative hydrolase of the HAD superfamily